ncbi:MAG: UPF0182 family protein [Armatimonadota bacterium]|nr:UPF0182 family protein [Armatimonadota bacterium]MDR7444790.1 UPF0182 family protein [Armatimonadota bacterium]MDR7569209.1 UPF0182 family protein [Armatimonadota bacterium]MDR7613327.1 UPF0182 family protein [Armatimonadota bacterium]
MSILPRLLLALLLLLGVVLWPALAYWYTEWLWFLELGYPRVFWIPFLSRLLVGGFVFAFVFALLSLNARPFLRRWTRPEILELYRDGGRFRPRAPSPWPRRALLGTCAGIAFLAALANTGQWLALQQFLHAQPAGARDPIFGLDLSTYLLRLPFWRFLVDLTWGWLLFTLVGVTAGYLLDTATLAIRGVWALPPGARAHLSVLLALLFLVRAVGFRLDALELLTSQRGLFFGMTYADLHARLPALNALFYLSLVASGLLFANAWLRTVRFAAGVVAVQILAWFVGVGLLPGLVQQLVVAPSELTRETPYLAHHIRATRAAFGLEGVRTQVFPAAGQLPPEALGRNRDTLENVRLWDYRPLLETYRQLQALRAYYTFHDVDIDRYRIGGRARQLMLAARELDLSRLPPQARTWVNEHLVYTHGYGAVASPVNRASAEGLPEFWIRDLPPQAQFEELRITRPEIYFGELTHQYVIVRTRVPEFDYPRGEENVTTRYQGRGGIPLSHPLRRLAFATRFGNLRILLSTDITSESRVLFARTVLERARRLAPFLRYDRDPYLVIANGRLFWILDAYTTSNRYPYAQPVEGINYIRNAVKVVVDAYHGTTDFYMVDPADPLIRTWARIFPGLFQPADRLPPELREHLRYPVDLFALQAQVYATYHMRDPRVFYNREDAWSWPTEIFAGQQQPMEPYYVTLRLQGEPGPEFALILPMTAQRRENMVAWLAARNDPPHRGELRVFLFPKERVVFGPMQVESRIDQDPQISAQLTLWNQQGSRVIRGNLLVIPIEDSILYVEPIFLRSETSQLPELKRVIVAHGPRIAMEETLEAALSRIFGTRAAAERPAGSPADLDARSAELVGQALEHYERAQRLLRSGDLGGYQREMEAVGRLLRELHRRLRP